VQDDEVALDCHLEMTITLAYPVFTAQIILRL